MYPQKLLGFILLNTKIIHFEHMFKQISNQVSVASYVYDFSKNKLTGLGFKVDLSKSIAIVATLKMGVN